MPTSSSHPEGFGSVVSSPVLPLVGRSRATERLLGILSSEPAAPCVAFVGGDPGVGKSRLVDDLATRARDDGWEVLRGQAYPVEQGSPYALFSDAFLPLLTSMEPDTLTVLSRGGERELGYLFPALGGNARRADVDDAGVDPEEFRTRLLWNFWEFVTRYAERTPMLLVLEDLHWADPSSLRLLHFLARQAPGHPVSVAATYSRAERDRRPALVQVERSLASLHVAEVIDVPPLTGPQLAEAVSGAFGVDAASVERFCEHLYGWTRGNPFFAEEILKSLVEAGGLRCVDGQWTGWDERDLGLPGSIRDAVAARMLRMSPAARSVVELTAVVGSRAPFSLLEAVSGLPEPELLDAVEELCAHGFVDESDAGGVVSYAFVHPVVRDTLYDAFGLQRARVLHGAVAEALEDRHGQAALEHADELAYHYARAEPSRAGTKALRYLAAAGERALERHADGEAVDYFEAALELAPADAPASRGNSPVSRPDLLSGLARGHLRRGAYAAALDLLDRAAREVGDDPARASSLLRSSALATFWMGRHGEALERLGRALERAETADDPVERVRTLLVRAHALQELGRADEARQEAEAALPIAEALGNGRLLARVHRTLALLHLWIGPPATARLHGERALTLAREVGDRAVEFWTIWGMAVQRGLMGEIDAVAEAVRAAGALAAEMRSPVLELWTRELSIEFAYATGEWDHGLALGRGAIDLARSLNQRALLPRLLVWTSLFHTGRGDLDAAEGLVREAVDMAGLGRDEPLDVHLVVPAYIGLAHYEVAVGEYGRAMDAARSGLEIAEGTGYTLWAVHRLLPIYTEAALWADDVDRAAELSGRLRSHAAAMDHRLGLAWADGCEALVRWKRGDPAGGAVLMRQAAEALEAIPMIPYAARLRRQLAGRLADIGDVDGALEELRTVHDVFARLGAGLELEKTRMQFRELGHRPPPRGAGEGIAGLTARELDIARLVVARKSNKAIGKALGISPRTASTHLSNIYEKLGLSSRGELADRVREDGLGQVEAIKPRGPNRHP